MRTRPSTELTLDSDAVPYLNINHCCSQRAKPMQCRTSVQQTALRASDGGRCRSSLLKAPAGERRLMDKVVSMAGLAVVVRRKSIRTGTDHLWDHGRTEPHRSGWIGYTPTTSYTLDWTKVAIGNCCGGFFETMLILHIIFSIDKLLGDFIGLVPVL